MIGVRRQRSGTLDTIINGVPALFILIGSFLLGADQARTEDTFSSLDSLKHLVVHEEWLLDQLDVYLEKEHQRLRNLKRRMDVISKQTEIRNQMTERERAEHVDRLVGHPLDAFHVIKQWSEVNQMTSGASLENFKYVTKKARRRGINVPDSLDYKGGIVALARLQKTYKLPTDDLVRGVVYNISAAQTLDHKDYMEMGKVLKEMDHSLAITWFEKLLEESNDVNVQIHIDMKDIYRKSGNFEKALVSVEKALEKGKTKTNFSCVYWISELIKDPQNERLVAEQKYLLEVLEVRSNVRSGNLDERHYWKSKRESDKDTYEALCRGDHINNDIAVNKALICIHRTGVLPYVRYKEEIHSFDPRISLFIDVISDRQADMLKIKGSPGLHRSSIGNPSKRQTSDYRISKVVWLWDNDTEVEHVSRKVGDITGLDTRYRDEVTSAEPFQVCNYGLGGQYEPHFDFYKDKTYLSNVPTYVLNSGDRLATFMFYLSDVKAGGATVFPHIGVRIPPVKNAAAFWYNFPMSAGDDSDDGDRLTLHAGCPVLLGQKWIGNKWIHQRNQLFKRPCGLTKYQIYPIWNK